MVSLLLLGGNTGDRLRHIRAAAAALARIPHCRVLARSNIYETTPVGPSRRRFLNMAVRLKTSLSPIGLLIELKRLESLAGRTSGPRWGSRPLDIDIITFGRRRLRSKILKIPHPLARSRAFVAIPMRDVAPGWDRTAKRLNPKPGTVRIYRRQA